MNATQVEQRHFEPYRFLEAWIGNAQNKENEILQAAEKLRGKTLTPFAESIYINHSNGMRRCRIGNWNVAPPRINPDSVVEVIETHSNGETRFYVNINERKCSCTEWYTYGIACRHGLEVWDVYHAQKKDTPTD